MDMIEVFEDLEGEVLAWAPPLRDQSEGGKSPLQIEWEEEQAALAACSSSAAPNRAAVIAVW